MKLIVFFFSFFRRQTASEFINDADTISLANRSVPLINYPSIDISSHPIRNPLNWNLMPFRNRSIMDCSFDSVSYFNKNIIAPSGICLAELHAKSHTMIMGTLKSWANSHKGFVKDDSLRLTLITCEILTKFSMNESLKWFTNNLSLGKLWAKYCNQIVSTFPSQSFETCVNIWSHFQTHV